jgi:hypothetical protein
MRYYKHKIISARYLLPFKPLNRSLRSDLYNFEKGVFSMKNRSIFLGVACLGLFANLFVAFAGKNLETTTANLFTNIGSVAIASALVFFMLSFKSETEERNEREEIYRDIDSIYRHIDDRVRDVTDEVRDLQRSCEVKCNQKK